jgi:telomere length regulation protein
MQAYLAHPDPKIRRLGMLVAEIVSELTMLESGEAAQDSEMADIEEMKKDLEGEEGDVKTQKGTGPKRLRFGKGMWDGEGEGKEECRWLRGCVGVIDGQADLREDTTGKEWMLGWDRQVAHPPVLPSEIHRPTPKSRIPPTTKVKLPNPRPKPKIIMLDPAQSADPLIGYSSPSASSSRSASPTQEYLDEVAADPTLALDTSQKAKIKRPVYVTQLIDLLKEREKPECLEVGLKWGEGLVRSKRAFGTELGGSKLE